MLKTFKKLSLAVLVPLCFALLSSAMLLGRANNRAAFAAERKPAAVFVLGDSSVGDSKEYNVVAATSTSPVTYVYKNHALGWKAAVDFSSSGKNFVKVELKSHWKAEYSAESNTTLFGSDDAAFSYGRIYVPSSADILFDLKGLNVDRDLYNRSGSVNGGVFYVAGNLEVTTDPELSNGKITGGNTLNSLDGKVNGNGGGVYVASGSFTLSGGEIVKNKAANFGGGIYCNTTLTINKGGVLSNESGAFGGAVYMGTDSKFVLFDGEISDNKSYARGAVCVFGEFSMFGGKISNNLTTIVDGHGVGGGVFLANGKFNMSGGEISSNVVRGTGTVAGGGVSLANNAVFNMTGGSVKLNKVVNEETESSKTAAGGVYIASGSQMTLGGNASLSYNEVVGAFNDVQGAGIYVERSSSARLFVEDNAEIAYNKAFVMSSEEEKVVGGIGGAIAAHDGVVSIKGGKIHHNLSANASAVYVANGIDKTVVSGGVIDENLNTEGAGAIYWSENSRPKFEGSPKVYNNFSLAANQVVRNVENYLYKDSNGDTIAFFAKIGASNVKVDAERRVYCSNLQLADNTEKYAFSVGKLSSDAKLSIGVATKHNSLTVGYKSNNNVSNVAVDPKDYFDTDSGNYLYVNESGELVELPKKLELKVSYQSSTKVIVKGYLHELTYGYDKTLTATLTYGSDDVQLKVLKDGGEVSNVNDAGKYTLVATVETSVVIEWNLVIKPKVVTIDSNIVFKRADNQPDKVYFDNTVKEYMFELWDGSKRLDGVKDYTKKREDLENKYAGEGKIRVTYKGNYSGEVVYPYPILTAEASYTKVEWQYADGKYSENDTKTANWKPVLDSRPNEIHNVLKYANEDFSIRVRAKLTAESGYVDYVYVKGHSQNETNMYLKFSGMFNGNEVTRFKDATTYTVQIEGTTNYVLSDNLKSTKLGIERSLFEINESSFAVDSSANRLWLLKIDENTSQGLGDRTLYFDSNAPLDEAYGAKVTLGDKENAYARFTDENLTLELNGNYLINNKPLSYYLASMSSITYSVYVGGKKVESVKGEVDTVTTVVTKVKLALNKNYVLAEGGKDYIELEKEWFIVTVNNTLRATDESGQVKVSDFTFGDKVNYSPFRPEHGDVAIYTFTKGQEVVSQFAIKYSDSSSLMSVLSYYEVKTVNKVPDIDLTRPIDEFNHYVDVLRSLSIGSYSLNVYVPRYQASGEHNHWWSNTKSSETTVYYPISCTYPFEVNRLRLTETNTGLLNKSVSVTMLETKVFYSGAENNIPELEVSFNGKKLVQDVDYMLESANVNVGVADFAIYGMGNFSGMATIRGAYEIEKAVNSWDKLPSINIWSYGDFKPSINLITAYPKLLDNRENLLFKVTTDEDGLLPVDGLAEFSLNEQGIVSLECGSNLAKLTVGKYYLFVWVKSSDNYEGLEESGVPFNVFKGVNVWTNTKGIASWTEGLYSDVENAVVVTAKFGDVYSVIKDKNGTVVYDSKAGTNDLANLKRGVYTLTSSVDGSDNFWGLDKYVMTFEVFAPAGLPVWVTPTAVGGALLLVAAILFILWRAGVFQLLTEKVVVAIRTKASIDATIAAVRAAKRMEEGRKSVEEADRREAEEKRKAELNQKSEESPKVEESVKAEAVKTEESPRAEESKKASKKKDN